MKRCFIYLWLAVQAFASCVKNPAGDSAYPDSEDSLSKRELAVLLSELPMGRDQVLEVHDAVSSSSGNGYDEEYMISDLLTSPGSGVGDRGTKSHSYADPIRDMLRRHLDRKYASTKSGASEVERYLNALSESDLQIYWPYSEDWDGETFPLITFDPGFGAESSYAYEIRDDGDGFRVTDSLLVTEDVAMRRPVWVINSNDDSAFTPFDFLTRSSDPVSELSGRRLLLGTFTMHRHYDSWFGGASEFWVKMGAVDGFKAASDNDLKLYSPSVTDMMIVVRRRDLGKEIEFNSMLLSSLTSQMEKLAFMIIEDDGGAVTNWKCSATVKYSSKSYGFDIDIPYRDKDDIVWRGQLDTRFFDTGEDEVSGRFGDVSVKFRLQ